MLFFLSFVEVVQLIPCKTCFRERGPGSASRENSPASWASMASRHACVERKRVSESFRHAILQALSVSLSAPENGDGLARVHTPTS